MSKQRDKTIRVLTKYIAESSQRSHNFKLEPDGAYNINVYFFGELRGSPYWYDAKGFLEGLESLLSWDDETHTKIGNEIIRRLSLTRKRGNGRIRVTGGDKNPCGLSRTLMFVMLHHDYTD